MPSSMIHLLGDYMLGRGEDGLFLAGSIAPDALSTREEKDHSHLRDRPDRRAALSQLALRAAPEDAFAQGVVFHLYFDHTWDEQAYECFRDEYEAHDPQWFEAYREEISIIGLWLFHHKPWARDVWQRMLAIPAQAYGHVEGLTGERMAEYIRNTYAWHESHDAPEPSGRFTPSYVQDYCEKTITQYQEWLAAIKAGKAHT